MSLEYKFENRGTVQVRPTGSDKRSPCWYMLAVAVLAMLGCAAWLFLGGYLTPLDSSSSHAMSLRGKIKEQETLIGQQADKLKSLEDQLATAKRDLQVQAAANDELSKKFSASAADLAAAQEKMKLYEGIVSPSGQEQGLSIQHFDIKPSLVDGQGKKASGLYQYHLELSNTGKGDVSVDGTYSIMITGKQNGKFVTVTQQDVTPEKEKVQTAFSVKNYQSLEGNLLFPKNFTPESIKLKISPATGDAPERLTQSYDWTAVGDSNTPTKEE
jgi:hypothetical protein